jgi:hypothetical protein
LFKSEYIVHKQRHQDSLVRIVKLQIQLGWKWFVHCFQCFQNVIQYIDSNICTAWEPAAVSVAFGHDSMDNHSIQPERLLSAFRIFMALNSTYLVVLDGSTSTGEQSIGAT